MEDWTAEQDNKMRSDLKTLVKFLIDNKPIHNRYELKDYGSKLIYDYAIIFKLEEEDKDNWWKNVPSIDYIIKYNEFKSDFSLLSRNNHSKEDILKVLNIFEKILINNQLKEELVISEAPKKKVNKL